MNPPPPIFFNFFYSKNWVANFFTHLIKMGKKLTWKFSVFSPPPLSNYMFSSFIKRGEKWLIYLFNSCSIEKNNPTKNKFIFNNYSGQRGQQTILLTRIEFDIGKDTACTYSSITLKRLTLKIPPGFSVWCNVGLIG